jgi:hypothetical protein
VAQSVFDIVKAPLGWSIFADNVKIGGIYGSKEAALEAAALAASFAVSEGAGVQINVPGLPEEKPNWVVAYEMAMSILPNKKLRGDDKARTPRYASDVQVGSQKLKS